MTKSERTKLFVIIGLSVLISFFVVKNSIRSFEKTEDVLFQLNEIGTIIQLGFLIILSVLSIIRVRKKKQFIYFLPLLICTGTLIFTEIVRQKINTREASPVIFQATYSGDINFLTIYLRKNKTYKLSDLGFYGGPNFFGEYHISGNNIILDRKLPLGGEGNMMSNVLTVGKQNVKVRLIKNESFEKDYLQLRIVSSKIANFN